LGLLSTHALLLIATGVTLYAGVFHGAFARHLPASRWLVGWALCAACFLVARTSQIATTDPELAVLSARIGAAVAPAMIWLLVRFVSELTGAAIARHTRLGLLACAVLAAGISLCTPWMMDDDATPRPDFFGASYFAPSGGPGLVVIGLATFGALGWSLRAIARTDKLAAAERRALGASLVLYAAMAIESLLSSLHLVAWPGIVEYAPLAVVIGTSHLAANRERRLESDLGATIEEQTAKLHASEERYRGLVEHAPLGVAVCDQLGNVVTMTERFRSIFGLSRAAGDSPRNLLRDAPQQLAREIQLFAASLATGKTASGELPYTTRAGRHVDLKFVIAPQRDAEGKPDGAIILAEDVTERRAVEARLRQSLKLEAIGQLAGGIATGVTTPMAEVRENLAALEYGVDALRKRLPVEEQDAERFAEIEELLAESREGVERAIAIVRDMREVARGGSLARESVDLNALLATVVRMAATQHRGGSGIVERYATLPRVLGNAGQLRQVFLNLLVNAIQAAGEAGHVGIETACEAGGVCVRVRDDGPGIAPEHRDRIFVPFFTTKPAGEGTGLGLYISYQIVQGHSGEIRVDSQPGAGATFTVWLPSEPAGAGVAA
jgi:PAS domain S-box-containing protein